MLPRQADLFAGLPAPSHHASHLTDGATICQLVRRAMRVRQLTGGTAEDVADELGLQPSQVQSALSELRLWGYVRKTDARRLSRKGGQRAVYISTETV